MSISPWARLALTAAMTMAVAAATAETGPVIREIKVTGTKRLEPETVKAHLTFAPGQRYDAYKADDSVKALFATGLFSDVRIKLEGSAVVVSVAENPLVNRVAFEGNKEIKSETLSEEVQTKPRGPL